MTIQELFAALLAASRVEQVDQALESYARDHEVAWVPVGGKPSNRGIIEVSADPGRSLVERLTNGIDAVLEYEHVAHEGRPNCRSPREAAASWLDVPTSGLSGLTPVQRRTLAQRVSIQLVEGEGRDGRCIEIRDQGIGLAPADMAGTILSLNESNKLQKLYLAGTYGQGGSSTFAVSKYSLIVSRTTGSSSVGFTVVRFMDLPAEEYKTGHYVYLVESGAVLQTPRSITEFPAGTLVKHFGYELSTYGSPVGPNSVYGLLNQVLFDPVLPVWLDNRVHNYRRVIKGSRNALNGAIDDGDERRGPALSHRIPMFYVSIADFGRIGVEYWVLEVATQENKRPSAAFVNPSKPFVLTINGQNQAELSSILLRKDAELPFLAQRFIGHVDCNSLTPTAKRALFVSNREEARRGVVLNLIQQELVRILKSDDELDRLNNEARQHGMHEQDEAAVQQMRQEVARLLRLHGVELAEAAGATAASGEGTQTGRPIHRRGPRPPPQPIALHEPPTYIRIVWGPGDPIEFYPEQRRYLRVETDANSNYHNPGNPATSRINFIIGGQAIRNPASTPLNGGRLRAIYDALPNARVGDSGSIRVELTRPGLATLFDERLFSIVAPPPPRPPTARTTLPPFKCRPVIGPQDELWSTLGWSEDITQTATSADMEEGTLIIYYSTVFPKYATQKIAFERRDPALASSFTKRYEIWLAVHSLLLYQDQKNQSDQRPQGEETEIEEARERQERCRIGVLASLVAAREVQNQPVTDEVE